MRWAAIVLGALACDAGEPPDVAPVDVAPAEREEEGTRLGVPERMIRDARREAHGLSRMPASLRERALGRGRERASVTYASLRREADRHANARVTYEGEVALVRPAGRGLWILVLRATREGDRWTDPLYVLSVVPPGLPENGGAIGRVDGWVVGERTVGRHTLPLVLAFSVERVGAT